MDPSQNAAPSTYLMVVQRGDEERYELLRKLFQSQRVEVVRDRRTGDRRSSDKPVEGNRRAGERRGAPPDSWVNLGFFVARRHVR